MTEIEQAIIYADEALALCKKIDARLTTEQQRLVEDQLKLGWASALIDRLIIILGGDST